MANSVGVWGLDIGRCALKALRCRLDGDAVVADGFDYIEYPKLLTQPEADAPQLIKEALEQFLSRNSLKGDKVAISVSGESGLARYFKPPPVDVKKIADIVKYEAKQQIPFALEDVIWDYQRLPGGQEVDGFALDTEIGLFAMKREQVSKSLAPYDVADIDVDVIQLAPIAIYNYIAYDLAKPLAEGEEYNSESPPESMIILSIGTDTSDLVVTNGYRVWQRNIPLGGNHFTKQLSKDLKLTFAKAEHLKRNPKQAEDPKTIFQAMRPVFADLVTEVQRSVGFFMSLDRKAKIGGLVLLGNTAKLPGLTQYLSKHLDYPVKDVNSFDKLSGSNVVGSSSFKDNILSFATCYGLCLQGLNKGKLATNLLPREILTQRMIEAKKPWAVGGVSALLLGLALSFVAYYLPWNEVHPDEEVNGVPWGLAVKEAKNAATYSTDLISKDTAKVKDLEVMQQIAQEVVGATDRRVLWLEVLKAVNDSLPPMAPGMRPTDPPPDPIKLPFMQRQDLKIEYIESQFFTELSTWFTDQVKGKYLQLNPQLTAAPAAAAGAPPATPPAATPKAATSTTPSSSAMPGMPTNSGAAAAPRVDVSGVKLDGPKGPGWVIEIKGHHYFNDPKGDRRATGPAHVRNTLLRNLEHGSVTVPLGPGQPASQFTMKELGIGYAILALDPRPLPEKIPNPNYVPPANAQSGFGTGSGSSGSSETAEAVVDPNNLEVFDVLRYDFIVQFCWQEKPLNVRIEERRKAEEAAAAAAAAAPPVQQSPATAPPPAGPQTTTAAPAPAVAVPQTPAPGAPTAVPAGEPATVPAGEPAPVTLPPAPAAGEPAGTPAAGVPAPAAPMIPVVPDGAGAPAVPAAAAPVVPVVPDTP